MQLGLHDLIDISARRHVVWNSSDWEVIRIPVYRSDDAHWHQVHHQREVVFWARLLLVEDALQAATK